MKVLNTKSLAYIKPLIQSSCTADAVADFAFRSANEVGAFLRSFDREISKTIEHSAMVAPVEPAANGAPVAPISGLDPRVFALNSKLATLQTQADTLRTVAGLLDTNFRKDSISLFQLLHPMQVRVDNERESVIEALGSIAKQTQPKQFRAASSQLLAALTQGLEGSYAGVFTKLLVNPITSGALFSFVIEFVDLQNENQQYVYPQFYVVLYGCVKANRLTMWVNTQHSFVLPDEAQLGTQIFDAASMFSAVAELMASDDFENVVSVPIELKSRELRPLASDYPVQDFAFNKRKNCLVLKFTSDPTAYGNSIARKLQQILGRPGIRWQQNGNNLEFEMLQFAPEVSMTKDKRSWLRHSLHASVEQLDAFEKHLGG